MNQRVYCKLNEPVTVGRRSFDFIAFDFAECPFDTGTPETMAFPAKPIKDGYEIADWYDLAVWYDSEPDFERYASEMNAFILCKDETRR